MVDIVATWVESSIPKLIKVETETTLSLFIEAAPKQQELMQEYKLRKNRSEVMIEDKGNELANLKEWVIVVQKRDGGSEGMLAMKADIGYL